MDELPVQKIPAIAKYWKSRSNQDYFNKQPAQNRNWSILFAVLTLGLVLLPQMVINYAWPRPFWNHHWLTGWTPLNFVRTSFDTPDGYASYNTPPLVFYGLEPFLNLRFLTPFVIPLALAGFITLWQKQRRSWQGWTLIIWWLSAFVAYSGIPYENERYTLTLLPPIAITAAIGLTALYEQIAAYFIKSQTTNHKPQTINQLFKLVLVLTLLGLVGLGWAGQRHMEGFFAFKNRELATVQATEQTLPPNARLITFGISLTYDHYYPLRPVSDLFSMTEADFSRLASQGDPLYLLVEPEVMQTQFANTPTGTIYQLVRAHAADPPLLQIGRYQLWKVKV